MKNDQEVTLTEHFFIVRLKNDANLIAAKQELSEEEKQVLMEQDCFSLEEIQNCKFTIFPINMYEVMNAIISNLVIPEINLCDT